MRATVITLGTDRFELRASLGRGGAGVVYEALDREHERVVALKLLPDMGADDISRLKHEFRVLADVAHPNLVRLYELVSDGVQWFFTMERVYGKSFLEHVRAPDSRPPPPPVNVADMETRPLHSVLAEAPTVVPRMADTTVKGNAHAPPARSTPPRMQPVVAGKLRVAELRGAMAQLAQAVCAIHAAGKLHCDLKPHNVLVTDGGRVVVLDFGLVTDARLSVPGQRARIPTSERESSVSGTPAYMAPEQAAGHGVTEASDWYAVGVMLYEALTGTLPFDGPVREVMRQKQLSDPPPPDLRAPDLPEDLCALCMALLRRAPQERPRGAEILERLSVDRGAPASSAPISVKPIGIRDQSLIGRARELAELEEALSLAEHKQAVTVYVHGEPGIGKSHLLAELLARASKRSGTVILAGRCYERERLPFKAVDSVIDALTAHLLDLPKGEVERLLPPDIHGLSRVFPVLLRVPAIAEVKRPQFEVPDPQALRRRAFSVLKELLSRLASRATLIVHIDDVQWGDSDSATLLSDLLAPPEPPPMLFIASYRTAEMERSAFVRALRTRFPPRPMHHAPQPSPTLRTVREVAVEPLALEDSVSLARALGSEAADVESIAKDAAGNPFFVAQLVQYLTSMRGRVGDAVEREARGGHAASTITLEQVLRERMGHLPHSALELLEVVSIAGRPISLALALSAAGVHDDDDVLGLLRAGAWLRSQGPRRQDAIECYHDRVREVVVQAMPRQRLRERHASIAGTLEQSGQGSAVDLAEHYSAAEQPEKAAFYAQRAAENATYALAFDDAARWYELALSLGAQAPLARVGAAAEQVLRVKLAQALANAGRTEAAAQRYLQAAEHAEPHMVLELQRRAAEQWLIGGHIDEGVGALRTVLGAVSMRLAKTPSRALLSLVARRARVKLRGLRWQRKPQSAIAPAELMRIDTCWSVATTLGTVDTIRAADFQARHLLLALSAGEPYRVARALAVEAGFAATSGGKGRERARAVNAVARTLAEELEGEHPHALGLSMMISGMTGYLMGEWKSALADCDAAERILLERCTGVLWELTNARRFALSSLSFMGNVVELSHRAPKLLTEARERGHLYAETDLRTRLLTLSWLAQDDPERAEQEAQDALRGWSRQEGFHLQHYNHMLTLAQCALYRGEAAVARGRLQAAWPALSRSMLLRIQALRAEVCHARARAILGLQQPLPASDLAEVERLAQSLVRERMPWTEPLAASLRAAVLRQRRDDDGSRRALVSAISGFDAVDMGLHAAASRARLGALLGGDEGADLRRRAEAYFAAQQVTNPQAMTDTFAPGF